MEHGLATRARTIVAALAVVAVSAGCGGGSGGGGGGGGGGPATVTVGTLPTANAAPMYLGMQKGFFSEQKITVQPRVAQGGNEIITGLVSGDNNFGFVGYIALGVAVSQNVPVCAVSASDSTGTSPEDDWQVIVASAGSSISGPKDLVGKTIGVNALKGVAEVMTKAALDASGVDPNSVKLIEVPFPQVPAALAGNRIDAGYAAEPFVTQVLGQGGKVVLAPGATIAPHFPNGAYVTSKQFSGKSGDVVKRFQSAMNKSVDYAQQHPDEVRAIIPTYTQIPADVASHIRLPYFSSNLDQPAIDKQLGFMQKYHVVDKAPSAKQLMC
jgi:NitT/TauT family transport system substrate-binding protein